MLDGLFASITLVVMFLLAPALAALVLFGAAVVRPAALGVVRAVAPGLVRSDRLGGAADSHFLESMRGIKTIKLFNGQDGRRAHWLNLLVETINRQLTTQKLRSVVPHREFTADRHSRDH